VCWQLPALAPVPEAASDQRAACFNPVPEPDHAAQAR